MRAVIRAIVFLASSVPLVARADAVDGFIEEQMRLQHIPGLSLAVLKDGNIVKAKGYGLANIETNTPATSETVYHLASVTKPMTATAILLLGQNGKIGLDDPVGKYIKGVPETWKHVTVRHLLSHTSGIKDYLSELHVVTREDTTPEKIIGLVAGKPLNFTPGENYAYSNTGYILLGMIVNEVSGKTYDAFLAEHVFGPLGMRATRRNSLDDIIPNRADGYAWTGDRWQNSPYLNPTLWDNGDGGMLSTVLDLAKWDAALSGENLLKGDIKRQMWTSGTLKDGKSFDYGFGWEMGQVGGHRLLGHGGSKPGASANISRYVDDGITVILLTNSRANTGRLSLGVARHYISSRAFDLPQR